MECEPRTGRKCSAKVVTIILHTLRPPAFFKKTTMKRFKREEVPDLPVKGYIVAELVGISCQGITNGKKYVMHMAFRSPKFDSGIGILITNDEKDQAIYDSGYFK